MQLFCTERNGRNDFLTCDIRLSSKTLGFILSLTRITWHVPFYDLQWAVFCSTGLYADSSTLLRRIIEKIICRNCTTRCAGLSVYVIINLFWILIKFGSWST